MALNSASGDVATPALSASISAMVSKISSRCSKRLLDPEPVHAGKGIGVILLEGVPGMEVHHCPIRREARRVGADHAIIELEAEKLHAARAKESLDLRQRHAVLLHVEQEIAAFAGTEEVVEHRDVLQGRA